MEGPEMRRWGGLTFLQEFDFKVILWDCPPLTLSAFHIGSHLPPYVVQFNNQQHIETRMVMDWISVSKLHFLGPDTGFWFVL